VTFEILLPPLIALLIGYLLGSIPFGVLLTRSAGAGDLRTIGSGNIGATNVLRTGRKGLAAMTLILDAVKGAVAILLVRLIFPDSGLLDPHAAVGALLGHIFPVWLGFKGGKGVATFIGILAALQWPTALVAAAVWLLMLAIFRYSSLAGITMALSAPVAAFAFGRLQFVLLFLGFALLIVWKHRENIARLWSRTEPKVGAAKAAADA